MTTARDVMTPGAKCVAENESVLDASVKLAELDVGAMPICGCGPGHEPSERAGGQAGGGNLSGALKGFRRRAARVLRSTQRTETRTQMPTGRW
jgi:hypothetical protein